MRYGSWKVGPTIGCGATATVSLAAESNSGDLFAVKSSLISRSALLQKEHSILSSLSSPHVISCHSFANSGEFSHLFLELAAGGALSALAGHLEELKIRSFTRQILLGLSYIHSKGIAHCDVKGSNVLLCSDDLVKLADFGCARWDGDGDRLVMGTPEYMAPEVVRGEEQGIAGDVWSLGCTVVEMVTGKSPWPEAENRAAAIHRISFSSDIPAMPEWVSDEGKDFVSKCFMRDPKERWTAEQLLCHPFVLEEKELCSSWKKGKRVSPKSTMEFDLWDSETEEDEQEKEEEILSSEEVHLTEGIRQLETPPANWGWDDRWIEVRESCAKSDEIKMPEIDFSKFTDKSECSCSGFVENGCEHVGLWTESMAAEVEELDSVSFAGEAEAAQETEYVWIRCNYNFDDINECQIS